MLEEREYQFLEVLSRNGGYSQRKLAHSLGVSLGLTNLILNRLVRKGYVKVKGLDKRKMNYILTRHGFSEKLKKSYNYTLKTIRDIAQYKNRIQEYIRKEYGSGERELIIKGSGDLADIAEIAVKNLNLSDLKWSRECIEGKDLIILSKNSEKEIISLLVEVI